MMFEEVWNYRFTPKSNLIDVHLGRLRKKLEAEGEPMLIHNVRPRTPVIEPASLSDPPVWNDLTSVTEQGPTRSQRTWDANPVSLQR